MKKYQLLGHLFSITKQVDGLDDIDGVCDNNHQEEQEGALYEWNESVVHQAQQKQGLHKGTNHPNRDITKHQK